MALLHNGDVGGHRDRTSDACFPKQEKREVENGIPRGSSSSSCRAAEDGSQGQSLSPSQENGFLSSRGELESEKDKDEDSLMTPRKKRGRRKLERPTKCESVYLYSSLAWGLSFDLLCAGPAGKVLST